MRAALIVSPLHRIAKCDFDSPCVGATYCESPIHIIVAMGSLYVRVDSIVSVMFDSA